MEHYCFYMQLMTFLKSPADRCWELDAGLAGLMALIQGAVFPPFGFDVVGAFSIFIYGSASDSVAAVI